MVLRRFLIILIAILLPATAFAARKYIVKRGDNLYDLSNKFGVTIDQMKSANELNGNRLDVGDELVIPDQEYSNEVKAKSNSGNNNEHIVSKGDTLSEIAEKYGITTESLKKVNGLNNSKLQVGQKLQIPVIRDEAPLPPPNEAVSIQAHKTVSDDVKSDVANVNPSATQVEYRVQKGDTLGHIAIKFHVTSSQIRETNGLKNDRLQIGQIIKLPSLSKSDEHSEQTIQTQSNTNHTTTITNGIYTVQKGDTPSKIAKKLGVNTAELIKLNNIKSTKTACCYCDRRFITEKLPIFNVLQGVCFSY